MRSDSFPAQPERAVQDRRCWLSAKWYVVSSLICSVGSIVAKCIADSLAWRTVMGRVQWEDVQNEVMALAHLSAVLAIGALVSGIPAVFRGNAVCRVAVLVAFLAAVAFLFLIV